MRIAIMQGRLGPPDPGRFQSFPRKSWREEFAFAADAELNAIEWIYDVHGADVNPLASDAGIAEMQALSRQHGIDVVSVCADYFLDRPLVRVGPTVAAELLAHLKWLLGRCRTAGITRIVLPFVDASRIETSEDERRAIEVVTEVLPLCAATGIELHLETSLAPEAFSALLIRLPDPLVRVNYDSGNSASLGYDVRKEFAAYGTRIGSVHVKDRIRGGGTVPLGTGDADLPAVFDALTAVSYTGDIVLQVARDVDGGEVEWARRNRAFVIQQLDQLRFPASKPAC
jgi:L-ribulose-5-phosphate 3-epimerase